jgi:hypothetical protein
VCVSYNAIHDPTISMVSVSTQIEGALDVLSAASLVSLAANGLPASMNGACVLFTLLELLNGLQSFGLQALLSGELNCNELCRSNLLGNH